MHIKKSDMADDIKEGCGQKGLLITGKFQKKDNIINTSENSDVEFMQNVSSM